MTDENMHAVGDDPAWSESYYFNFIDPVTKLGMFTRMGFRPGNGWADALHVLYLPGKRVAFTYGRREIEAPLTQYDGDLSAGQLAINCIEPFQRWQVQYDGPAQDIANAEILLERSKLLRSKLIPTTRHLAIHSNPVNRCVGLLSLSPLNCQDLRLNAPPCQLT